MAASVTHTKVSTVPPTADPDLVSSDDWNDDHTVTIAPADIGAAPAATVDYLVGTATSALDAEIAVGTTPGGELGGTWASPTVGTTHSGTSHAGVISSHEGAADPHTGYVREDLLDAAGDLYVASADNTPAKLTKGTQGQVLAVGASTIGYEDRHIPVTFSKQGTVAVTTEATALRWYNDTGRTLTIDSVRASVVTAPTGATLIVDVNMDGTTIYTTGPGTERPAIAISGNTDQGGTPDVTTVATGHYISVNVDQVGSTIIGSDLTVVVWLKG